MKQQQLIDSLVRRGFLKALRKYWPSHLPDREAVIAEVGKLADEMLTEPQNQALAVDDLAVSNLKISALALAGYRVLLQANVEHREALAVIKDALVEPNRKKIAMLTSVSLRISRDPLKMMASISQGKQRSVYGDGFVFEHESDDMHSFFTTNVKKCLYHDFFRANGAPELTAVFCSYDDAWSDIMQTARYRVQFTRPTTIAAGDDMCRFHFRRTKVG